MNDPALVEALLERVPGAARSFIARHDAFLRKTVLSASRAAAPLVDDLTHDAYVHLWGNDFRVLRQWHAHSDEVGRGFRAKAATHSD